MTKQIPKVRYGYSVYYQSIPDNDNDGDRDTIFPSWLLD